MLTIYPNFITNKGNIINVVPILYFVTGVPVSRTKADGGSTQKDEN